ncbi:MAG: penicillin acylase family protein [Gemmatimonadetes bacterium]|nr:penicillin acylase family protein [Gemmatimonadota bacterium]
MRKLSRFPAGTAAGLALGAVAALLTACAGTVSTVGAPDQSALASQVEVRRTTYGVPQIHAENLRAAAFALAYVQLEDHGDRIVEGLQTARGQQALLHGRSRVDADARNRLRHARAAEGFHLLSEDTREVYEGFAAGVNHFIRSNPGQLPGWMLPDFTAIDVLARDITWPSEEEMNTFRRRVLADPMDPVLLVEADGRWQRSGHSGRTASIERSVISASSGHSGLSEHSQHADSRESAVVGHDDAQNVGSNAWALAPSRTVNGNAILMRNPHLAWSAGYYEAHLRVPGKLDFYGDFRVGGPFTVIGGFNRHLGFSTTNNESRTHEFYAFRMDPSRADHYLLDGASLPLIRESVEVPFNHSGHTGRETRDFWSTRYGPIIHRSDSLVYVFRSVNEGDHRAGEQWLEMMKATTMEEWRGAMRIGARMTSNFIYADADGNILYVSVQPAPLLPHPAGGDSVAILATRSDQIWSRVASFDSLPQLVNPVGGYVRNENDSPHFTNLNQILEHSFPFWVQEPRMRLRSQHGALLLHNDRRFTLEDVVDTKHSMRMLLADRVKDELIQAVRESGASGDLVRAINLLSSWDNTASAGSRGSVLFEIWWDQYRAGLAGVEPFAVPWTADAPMTTPHGIAEPQAAVEAFGRALRETTERYGAWDVAWGDVHRVRRGEVDVPVGGCGGALGCFRVLSFSSTTDGKRVVNGGDGWVIAVEFGDEPRAYSVLAYGQSTDPSSPYHANQAALFASNEMKPVLWTEADIEAAVRERYRPGEPREQR